MDKRNFSTDPVRVFIAVGHGGSDPGAVCGDIKESDCNLVVALTMESELKRHGMQVKLSRYCDEEDRLREEIVACNNYGPELAIAIHTNAGGGKGFEVLCRKGSWENNGIVHKLAQFLQKQVQSSCQMPVRDIKFRSDLGWLNQVQAPTVLCENFFVDEPNAHKYAETGFLKKIGKAYAMAILELYGIVYRPESDSILRFSVVEANDYRKECSCFGLLLNGHHYVQLRQLAAVFGFGVYYEVQNKGVLLYPQDLYAESDFGGEHPLKIDDFPTKAERLLNGIAEPDLVSADYALEEFDLCDNL